MYQQLNIDYLVVHHGKRVVPLTNTQVKQAKESDKEYTLSDGDGLNYVLKRMAQSYGF